MHTRLGSRAGAVAALALVAACGVDEPTVSEATSQLTVADFTTSSCTTAVVIGLATQIADEINCLSPTSLTRFSATSGITFTSNAVLPFLAANAKADLQKVGNVQVNSAFRTVPQQFLLLEWFNLGRCGITAAAAVGRSNHESGRAVDLANASSRVTAMASHGWSHDVPGDPVHFDHLSSADIRGKDTLAFQRLWNRNHPGDLIAADGIYGPQTESRLKKSPATGFATGAFCKSAATARVAIAAVDGPDRVAPGTRAHYKITLSNTSDAEWPATAMVAMADGQASQLYDQTTWVNNIEIGPIGAPIAAGGLGVFELDILAPSVATATPLQTELAVKDGDTELGSVTFAVTVTPDGDENLSGDSDDQNDEGTVSGGCTAGRGAGGAGLLALAPVLLVLRRRRR